MSTVSTPTLTDQARDLSTRTLAEVLAAIEDAHRSLDALLSERVIGNGVRGSFEAIQKRLDISELEEKTRKAIHDALGPAPAVEATENES